MMGMKSNVLLGLKLAKLLAELPDDQWHDVGLRQVHVAQYGVESGVIESHWGTKNGVLTLSARRLDTSSSPNGGVKNIE